MIEHTLKHPIEMKDSSGNVIKTITTVILDDRLKAKHYRKLPADVIERMSKQGNELSISDGILFLQALSNLTDDEFGEIDMIDDVPDLVEKMNSFLEKSS